MCVKNNKSVLMCQFVMMCLFYTHWLKIMCEIHLILSCVDLTQFTKCVFTFLKCVVFINSMCAVLQCALLPHTFIPAV